MQLISHDIVSQKYIYIYIYISQHIGSIKCIITIMSLINKCQSILINSLQSILIKVEFLLL